MNVVVSQSMYFPWIGLLEQIQLADYYVYYDDVPYSKGSFVNRVQLKFPSGTNWMTIPLERFPLGTKIDELKVSSGQRWVEAQYSLLNASLSTAPYYAELERLFLDFSSNKFENFISVARGSIDLLVNYFSLGEKTNFLHSSELKIGGKSSERVLNIVRELGGATYITGHGAKNYLDHLSFEENGIEVRYMDYQKRPYPQLFGAFIPYVSSLDLIANCGRAGRQYICSDTLSWREFLGSDKNESD